MRTVLFLMLILFCGNLAAQKTPFLRIYDFQGKKIYKGKVYIITDSSLSLIGKKEPLNIPIKEIGYIKTKHSDGNNIVTGSVAGLLIGALMGALANTGANDIEEPVMTPLFTTGEVAAAGAIVGVGIGAAIGGITIAFKNSKTFHIDGDATKWQQFASIYEKK
jgi:hypothetical protein